MNLLYDLVLFFPCFVSLFWGVNLLWSWKQNLKPQNIWTVFMFVFAVCNFIWGILFRGIEDYGVYYKLDVLDITITLFIFPFIYLYFHALTKGSVSWKQYLWFVPGLLIGVVSAGIYLWMGEERSVDYIRSVVVHPDGAELVVGTAEWLFCIISVYLLVAVLFVQVVVGMTYSTRNLIRYKRGLSNFFSNLDEKSIHNNRAVLAGVYVLLILALLAISIWYPYYEQYIYMGHILMAVMGVVIYYMGYLCRN